jgi:hypothetical protein
MSTIIGALEAATQELHDNAEQYFAMSAAITAQLNAKKAEVDAALASMRYAAATTIGVGPGQPFASLSAAIAAMRGKVFAAPVVLQLTPGVHEIAGGLAMTGQPWGAGSLTIRGDPVAPANCELRFIAGAGGVAPWGLAANRFDCTLTGVRLRSAPGVGTALSIADSSIVMPAGTVIVEDFEIAMRAYQGAFADAQGLSVVNCLQAATANSALVYAHDMVATGRGKVSGGRLTAGLAAYAGASIVADRASLTGFPTGVLAQQSGFVQIKYAALSTCARGLLAELGGAVVAPWEPGDATRLTIANCDIAGWSNWASRIFVPGSRVTGGATGYRASDRSYLHADGSGATGVTGTAYLVETGAYITALDTAANCSGNGADYNLASDAPSASGALMRRS